MTTEADRRAQNVGDQMGKNDTDQSQAQPQAEKDQCAKENLMHQEAEGMELIIFL